MAGWERGNESMEGPAILAYSAGLAPLVSRLFLPPPFVLELLITSLSPLHCIPHSFVILPKEQIRESPLSATTLFLCLTLPFSASVHSISLAPAAYDVMLEQRLLESDPRSIELVSSEHFCVVNRPLFCFRRVLPLFGESVSCFKKSVLPFQSGCMVPYFLPSKLDVSVRAAYHVTELVIHTRN